jgi:hypothetical protein
MQLNLDQVDVIFLQRFFDTANCGEWDAVTRTDLDEADMDTESTTAPIGAFIQRCQVEATALTVNYRPRGFDAAALRSGSWVELLNLVPWGATLQLRRLRLYGVDGLEGLRKTLH